MLLVWLMCVNSIMFLLLPTLIRQAHSDQRGRPAFSLVEILVVTSIISLSFIAVLGLIKRSITLYYSNQNQLMATVIAQDGLELVRFVRDENWTTGQNFYENIAQTTDNDYRTISAIDYQVTLSDSRNPGHILDARPKLVQYYNTLNGNNLSGSTCNGNLDCYLKDERSLLYTDNSQHGFYAVRSAIATLTADHQPTIFHRLVQTTYNRNGTDNTTADDFLYVTVKVYWTDHGSDKYYTVNSYLFNYSWRYRYEN